MANFLRWGTERNPILGRRRTALTEFVFDFRLVVPCRNYRKASNVTGVENRGQMSHFFDPSKLRVEVGRRNVSLTNSA